MTNATSTKHTRRMVVVINWRRRVCACGFLQRLVRQAHGARGLGAQVHTDGQEIRWARRFWMQHISQDPQHDQARGTSDETLTRRRVAQGAAQPCRAVVLLRPETQQQLATTRSAALPRERSAQASPPKRTTALAAHAVLRARRGGDLARAAAVPGHHLQHVRRAGAHALRAADAGVVDLHRVRHGHNLAESRLRLGLRTPRAGQRAGRRASWRARGGGAQPRAPRNLGPGEASRLPRHASAAAAVRLRVRAATTPAPQPPWWRGRLRLVAAVRQKPSQGGLAPLSRAQRRGGTRCAASGGPAHACEPGSAPAGGWRAAWGRRLAGRRATESANPKPEPHLQALRAHRLAYEGRGSGRHGRAEGHHWRRREGSGSRVVPSAQ